MTINIDKPILDTALQHKTAYHFVWDTDRDKWVLDTAQQHIVAHHSIWDTNTKKPVLGTAQQHDIAQHSATNQSLMWQSGEIQDKLVSKRILVSVMCRHFVCVQRMKCVSQNLKEERHSSNV
jgi:hypothetical protein